MNKEAWNPFRRKPDEIRNPNEERAIPIPQFLTDRGTEFCGLVDTRVDDFFLAFKDIYHTRMKGENPLSNEICDRSHKTLWEKFYTIAFRKKT